MQRPSSPCSRLFLPFGIDDRPIINDENAGDGIRSGSKWQRKRSIVIARLGGHILLLFGRRPAPSLLVQLVDSKSNMAFVIEIKS